MCTATYTSTEKESRVLTEQLLGEYKAEKWDWKHPVQQVLQPKDPCLLSDDMVFTLLAHGRSLELMDEMCPLCGTYSSVGGHLCGKN